MVLASKIKCVNNSFRPGRNTRGAGRGRGTGSTPLDTSPRAAPPAALGTAREDSGPRAHGVPASSHRPLWLWPRDPPQRSSLRSARLPPEASPVSRGPRECLRVTVLTSPPSLPRNTLLCHVPTALVDRWLLETNDIILAMAFRF